MLKRLARQWLPRRWWTALRLARIRWGVALFRARDVTHRYGSLPLTIHLADPMAEGWYDHDWDEPADIALLKTGRLTPGARVFDLGAHQGVVALMLAHAVGPRGSVVAVEANAHNAAVARRNRDCNAARQVEVIHAAAAEHEGTLAINDSLNAAVDGSGEWGRTEVPAVSVDGLARRYGTPDVLYIDVEGYECSVLRGAAETLRQRPDLFVEVHATLQRRLGGSVGEVLRALNDPGYRLFAASQHDATFRPLTEDAPILHEGRFFLVAIGNGPSRT